MHELDFLRVVIDDTDTCPYLPQQVSRLPLCIPLSEVTGERLDTLLAAGYRRSGWFYYRTRCPACSACEPLRLEVADFAPSRSQRRARRLGDQHLQVTWSAPTIDQRRIDLFNKHRLQRGLDHQHPPATAADYQSFLLNASCSVIELSLRYAGQLVAVSITDVGRNSLSAVYCYFDPDFSWLGLGTYAILLQIELAQSAIWRQTPQSSPAYTAGGAQTAESLRRGVERYPASALQPRAATAEDDLGSMRWLYLGLYVAQNRHLNYKARFLPHERLVNGSWQRQVRGATNRQELT